MYLYMQILERSSPGVKKDCQPDRRSVPHLPPMPGNPVRRLLLRFFDKMMGNVLAAKLNPEDNSNGWGAIRLRRKLARWIANMTTADTQDQFTAASAWRRLAAFGIDYGMVVVPYLGLLGLVGWALVALGITPFDSNRPWVNQGMVVLFLTLPIASYFAICEASKWQATLGKRLMKVAVVNRAGKRVTLKRSFARVAVKFLPWEYFHTILWQWEGWPMNPSPPTTFQIVAMTVGWLVMGGFIISLFVGSRRTPYDWVAGTVAIAQSSTSDRVGG